MKKILVIGILFLITKVVSAQHVQFELVFGTSDFDDAKCVIQTYDSGYAVVGSTSGVGSTQTDVYLTKISKTGTIEWQKTIGSNGIEIGKSIVQTHDSGFAIVGLTNNSFNEDYNVYLIKTNSYGDTLWTKQYGGTDWDFGEDLQITKSGGFILCGGTYSFGHGNLDVYLINTDSSGTLLWDSAYGGTESDYGNSVCNTIDNGYFITGFTKSFGEGDTDVYLIKTNENGQRQWSKTYGGLAQDVGKQGKQTADSGYIVIGHTKSFGSGNFYDFYLLKTDQFGDTIWSRKDSPPTDQFGTSVVQTKDGSYAFAGSLAPFPGNANMMIYKVAASNFWINSQTYGGIDWESASSLQQTYDSGFVAVGVTYSYGNGRPNIYILKTDNNLVSTGNVAIMASVSETQIPYENKFYPNPVNNYFDFMAKTNSNLRIYNSIGQCVIVFDSKIGINRINTEFLVDGFYISIWDEKGKTPVYDKLIVRH